MAGFDEHQPRDENGQWTDTGSAMKRAASDIRDYGNNYIVDKVGVNAKIEDASTRGGLIFDAEKEMEKEDVDLDTRVAAVDNAIRHQPYETVVLFQNDGRIFGLNSGDEGSVSLKLNQSHMAALDGGIGTHNHPYDQSFSNGDVYTVAALGLKEFRAIAAGHDYIYRPNRTYWNEEYVTDFGLTKFKDGNARSIVGAYNQSLLDVQKSYTDAIEAGALSVESANANFQHKIMEVFAERTGSYYEKRPLPAVRTDVPRDLYSHSKYEDFEAAELRRSINESRKKFQVGEALRNAASDANKIVNPNRRRNHR